MIIPSSRINAAKRTLFSLLEQDFEKDDFEIILVTQYIKDFDELKNDRIRFAQVPQTYPPGRMRNIGSQIARGTYLAFIDDDCVPPPNWLRILLDSISRRKDIGAVGCRVVANKKRFWPRCADFVLFSAYQYRRQCYIDLGSAAIMVNKSVFREVKGFNEQLLASEDWDLSLRLRKAGSRCLFTPEVEVLHHHGRETFFAIIRSAFSSGLHSGLTVQKKNRNQLSWLAKLSLRFGSPFLYWLLIVPYSTAVTIFQAIEFIKTDLVVLLYIPMIFLGRLAYHCGVVKQLTYDN